VIAALSGVAVAVLVALPTAVIPNPVFGRAVAVTWWSYPVVIMTGVLGGLLFATYVRDTDAPERFAANDELDGASKLGMAGTLISFFAVGCPVCNKLVLLALGATGAVTWFAPLQPFLALASIVLMVVALRIRLTNEVSCQITPNSTTPSGA
jgi:H+/Cl- antiporter ClcA